MARGFFCACAVVDDPDFRKMATGKQNLVEVGVVVDGVAVQPVGADLRPVIGGNVTRDIAQSTQLVYRLRGGDLLACTVRRGSVDVNELGVLGDRAVVVLIAVQLLH